MAEVSMLGAVTMAMARAMEDDPNVVVIGEDVGVNGGVFRATEGLLERFGEERVLDTPLADVVTSVNRFLCDRVLGEKYATMMMARIHPDGGLEYVNCGHVPPLLISADHAAQILGHDALSPGEFLDVGSIGDQKLRR